MSAGVGWAITGDGTLSGITSPVTFTAGGTPGTATVIVGGHGIICTASSIIFTVIAPSAVANYNIDDNVNHNEGLADIGFKMYVYEMPNTVSFYNAYVQEAQAPVNASGIYACMDGKPHESPGPIPAPGTTNVGIYGTQMNAVDTSYSSYCTGDQLLGGTESVSIPTQYAASPGGPWTTVTTISVNSTATTAGALNRTKDHAHGTKMVSDPSSAY
jgi:hypothetical protein